MNTPMKKGSFQYIKRRKRRQMLLSISMFSIAFGILLLGLLLNKFEKANIFTVFAVLFVLPSAKMLISYIILIPFHSVSKDSYDRVVESVSEGVIVYTDVVFSSPEKVMNLDFIVLDDHNMICYAPNRKKLLDMERYLRDGVKKRAFKFHVEAIDEFDRFVSRINKLEMDESKKDQDFCDFIEYLESLMV